MSTDYELAWKVARRMVMRLQGPSWREIPTDAECASEKTFEELVEALVLDRQHARIVLHRVRFETSYPYKKHTTVHVAYAVAQLRRAYRLIEALTALSDSWICRPDGLYVQLRDNTARVERIKKEGPKPTGGSG